MAEVKNPPTDRSDWTVRKCESFEEMERVHIREWQKVSCAERMKAAWEMVEEAWAIQKRDPNELRFQRVARCITRGGS